jgi:adenylate cyclase
VVKKFSLPKIGFLKTSLRTKLGLLILLVLLGHSIREFNLPFIAPLENQLYDIKLRHTLPSGTEGRIVILDIDEKSLAELGRWPWGRDRMATLVNKLFDQYFVAIVGFDIVMAEADTSSGLQVLDKLGATQLKNDAPYREALEKIRPELEYDKLFAESLKDRRTVLGYYFTNDKDKNSGALPKPTLPGSMAKGRNLLINPWRSFGGNLPLMQEAALAGGHFNPDVDIDGNVRRADLLEKFGDNYYESLSLAMVRALLNSPNLEPIFGDGDGYTAIEALRMSSKEGTITVPVDKHTAALVPYRGPSHSFKYISVADVLKDRVKIDDLADKIILVGTSAPGLLDLRATPVGSPYPGVEIHANLIAGMLDGTIKERPQFADATESILLLALGLLMIFAFPWRSPLRSTIATVLALVVVIGINLGFWQYLNWVVALAPTLLMVGLLFVLNMSLGYFTESKAKRQFTQLFGQYVPPELVVEMSKNPESYTMAGRRKEMTVLFSDVRGFTTISEGMEPEALAQLMNEYLGAMTIVIRKRGGTLDKYIGDAIMAFWGAPIDNPNHAREAVLSAMEMLVALDALNVTLEARGTKAMKIGIGINTGPMTVGDMGSTVRLAYTVMGDAVNLGARLEGKTKDYGIALMVGQGTKAAVDDIVFRELDCVQVKGKDEPITTYEPMGMVGEIPEALQKELALWDEALALYRKQEWDASEAKIFEIQKTNPEHKLYHLYLERIAEFRLNPPGPEWTGVMRFDSK